VPKHLSQQWPDEVKKFTQPALKTIIIQNHGGLAVTDGIGNDTATDQDFARRLAFGGPAELRDERLVFTLLSNRHNPEAENPSRFKNYKLRREQLRSLHFDLRFRALEVAVRRKLGEDPVRETDDVQADLELEVT
jgi:hypothetical protein